MDAFIPAQARDILQSTVQSLQTNDETDLIWEGTAGHVEFCLSEMRRNVSQPIRPAYRGHVPGPNPDAQIFRAVIPNVEKMLMAMRQRNRGLALEAGNAAIAKL